MENNDYQLSFDDYLKKYPDMDPEVAELFKPTYDKFDDEFFAFIMSNVVL